MTRIVAILVLALLAPLTVLAAGNSNAAYFACRSCHGDSGLGADAINVPAIAGQSQSYLARQLRNYRDGIRGNTPRDIWGSQMALMAANLDDEGIEKLAQSVAKMPPWPSRSNGEEAAAPKEYTACAACHGEQGEGLSETNSPRISGLDPLYLARQLRNFRDGLRGQHPGDDDGRLMRAALPPAIDNSAIDRLAAYIAALQKK